MTQLISNVLMQPSDATERLTLVEKLEQKESEVSQMMQADDAPFPYHYMAGKLNAFREIVNIVKQHQAESGWVSVDERLPEHDGTYPALADGRFGIAKFDLEYNAWLFKNFEVYELMANVTHWMPIPKPPIEVQGD